MLQTRRHSLVSEVADGCVANVGSNADNEHVMHAPVNGGKPGPGTVL
jgi:hypothetical protein